MYSIEVFEGVDGKYYWHVLGSNNKIVVHSQGYTSKWSARRTARKIAKGLNASLRVV